MEPIIKVDNVSMLSLIHISSIPAGTMPSVQAMYSLPLTRPVPAVP